MIIRLLVPTRPRPLQIVAYKGEGNHLIDVSGKFLLCCL